MKPILLSILIAIAAVSIAQTPKSKAPAAAPTEIACPVMPSHKVKIAQATKDKMFADYKGRRYFFCCAGCPPEFKADPAKFAKAASIAVPIVVAVKIPTEIACPVMPSHKVNIVKATKDKMFADYKGRRYFFCCAGCPPAFKANPAKFAKAASISAPKPPVRQGASRVRTGT